MVLTDEMLEDVCCSRDGEKSLKIQHQSTNWKGKNNCTISNQIDKSLTKRESVNRQSAPDDGDAERGESHTQDTAEQFNNAPNWLMTPKADGERRYLYYTDGTVYGSQAGERTDLGLETLRYPGRKHNRSYAAKLPKRSGLAEGLYYVHARQKGMPAPVPINDVRLLRIFRTSGISQLMLDGEWLEPNQTDLTIQSTGQHKKSLACFLTFDILVLQFKKNIIQFDKRTQEQSQCDSNTLMSWKLLLDETAPVCVTQTGASGPWFVYALRMKVRWRLIQVLWTHLESKGLRAQCAQRFQSTPLSTRIRLEPPATQSLNTGDPCTLVLVLKPWGVLQQATTQVLSGSCEESKTPQTVAQCARIHPLWALLQVLSGKTSVALNRTSRSQNAWLSTRTLDGQTEPRPPASGGHIVAISELTLFCSGSITTLGIECYGVGMHVAVDGVIMTRTDSIGTHGLWKPTTHTNQRNLLFPDWPGPKINTSNQARIPNTKRRRSEEKPITAASATVDGQSGFSSTPTHHSAFTPDKNLKTNPLQLLMGHTRARMGSINCIASIKLKPDPTVDVLVDMNVWPYQAKVNGYDGVYLSVGQFTVQACTMIRQMAHHESVCFETSFDRQAKTLTPRACIVECSFQVPHADNVQTTSDLQPSCCVWLRHLLSAVQSHTHLQADEMLDDPRTWWPDSNPDRSGASNLPALWPIRLRGDKSSPNFFTSYTASLATVVWLNDAGFDTIQRIVETC
jgi:hypothetical protein